MVVTGAVKVTVTAARTFSGDLESGSSNIAGSILATFTNGTTTNDIDLVYQDTCTLTTGATQTYDLDGLTDPITGGAVAFVKIRAIIIYSKLTANKVLTIGGGDFQGPFTAAADSIDLPPEGFYVVTAPVDGWTVTADSGDGLLITNAAGGSSTFDIYIMGASA